MFNEIQNKRKMIIIQNKENVYNIPGSYLKSYGAALNVFPRV